jgi:hypothetical protein
MKLLQALTQPNFSDCGVYLLHFARKFASDPQQYCKYILQRPPKAGKDQAQQEAVWDGEGVKNLRDSLHQRISSMSAAWKMDKEKQDKEKKEEPETVESSDDEVIVESANLASASESVPKTRTQARKKTETALRIR